LPLRGTILFMTFRDSITPTGTIELYDVIPRVGRCDQMGDVALTHRNFNPSSHVLSKSPSARPICGCARKINARSRAAAFYHRVIHRLCKREFTRLRATVLSKQNRAYSESHRVTHVRVDLALRSRVNIANRSPMGEERKPNPNSQSALILFS